MSLPLPPGVQRGDGQLDARPLDVLAVSQGTRLADLLEDFEVVVVGAADVLVGGRLPLWEFVARDAHVTVPNLLRLPMPVATEHESVLGVSRQKDHELLLVPKQDFPAFIRVLVTVVMFDPVTGKHWQLVRQRVPIYDALQLAANPAAGTAQIERFWVDAIGVLQGSTAWVYEPMSRAGLVYSRLVRQESPSEVQLSAMLVRFLAGNSDPYGAADCNEVQVPGLPGHPDLGAR